MAEIVYGTKEEGHVMSDKVSQLASSVYSEFEKMIKKYDEDVVKELMPLVVGILESLDQAFVEKQETEVEMELLREDNEQLLTQYEREKQLRKAADQKFLEMEDENEEFRKATEEKIETFESNARMMELKNKNFSDHVSRMEDKEAELKKEYNKVHERYTELMRTHMDYMERAKLLMGADRMADLANSPRSSFDRGSRKGSFRSFQDFAPPDLGGFNLPNLKPVNMISMTGSGMMKSTGSPPDASAFDLMSPRSGKDSNISIKSELSDLESPDINSNTGRNVVMKTSDKEQNTDCVDVREFATGMSSKSEDKPRPQTSESVLQNSKGSKEVVNKDTVEVHKDKDTIEVTTETKNEACETSLSEPNVMTSENAQNESESLTKNKSNLSNKDQAKVDVTPHESAKVIESKAVTAANEPEVVVKDNPEVITSEIVGASATSKNEGIIVICPDSTKETTEAAAEPLNEVSKDEAEVSDKNVSLKQKDKPRKPVKKEMEVIDKQAILEASLSPIYDSNDFQFEEDVMPGLDDTLAHIKATTPELDDMDESMESSGSANNNRQPKRNDASIYDELTIQDADLIGDVDYGADITGRAVNPADYASSDSEDEREERNSNVSDNFFGMSRELENLILENTELLATKNALNIVKDDLIAKVDELSSEQEILKEEITSLQGVRNKLQGRIKELEEEVKKVKEELEKKNQATQEAENEDDVPMAQRKRFTRVEMARVLMERNQYKERLMELQEAVRWTEMIRASREHPDITQSKKKSSIWNFFSNLFNSPNKPSKKPMAMVKYNAPTTNVQPVGDPNQKQRSKYNLGDKTKAYDFLQDDLSKSLGEPIVSQPDTSEKAKREREKERKEQYKQVRAHVKKDDGRMQAYGWSLPAKFTPQVPSSIPKSSVGVPVPVYCRPLLEEQQGLKIWCAAGVNLTGGKTKDGGSIVGASVFYSSPPESELNKTPENDIDKLDQELKDHEDGQKDKEQLSSFVWICTSSINQSNVSVIDANSPGDILETFRVCTTPILCIASVPGALESDYPVDEDILKAESYPQMPETNDSVDTAKDKDKEAGEETIGGITFVQCATGEKTPQASPIGTPPRSRDVSPSRTSITEAVTEALSKQEDSGSAHSGSSSNLSDKRLSSDGSSLSQEKRASLEYHTLNKRSSFEACSLEKRASLESLFSRISTSSVIDYAALERGEPQPTVFKARGSPACSGTATPEVSSASGIASRRLLREPNEMVRDGINALATGSNLQDEEVEKTSSVLPTMWMGSQSGSLYVHSSVSQWRRCLHSVKLRDSVLHIVHVKGRVLVALADGTVAIFHRDTDGQWDLQNYHLLDLGKPHHSIRCMTVIANKHVWCGYRNKIHVVDPQSMVIEKSFDAHPRKESQVRQLAWVGDGVWVSIRLDSTLRLYHAYTHQHLQDVDIEPYVSKMLGTGKLGFSFVRITSMLITCNRLWIGTGNGVIISVPLSESNKQAVSMGSSMYRPGGLVRVYSDNKDGVMPGSFIPYCTMAQAQLSFHGHRDAVKFFVAVPAPDSPTPWKQVLKSSLSSHVKAKEHKKVSFAPDTVETSPTGQTPTSLSKASSPASSSTSEPISDDNNRVTRSRLVLSGGEGYVDFRIVFNLRQPKAKQIIGDGDDDASLLLETDEEKEEKASLSKGERSHLIVWEVIAPE